MVSFWPFRGHTNSTESFEKILSQLSAKINKTGAERDSLRQKQRRYRVLWTLYTAFAYILVTAILTLVTGWENWSYAEYGAVVGGPVLILGVRALLDTYYTYRIASYQGHLDDLNKKRNASIEKLKAATKFNCTQQLLEKYGGSPPGKRQSSPQPRGERKPEAGAQAQPISPPPSRTGLAPPPTANIPSQQPRLALLRSSSGPIQGPIGGLVNPAQSETNAPSGQEVAGEEFAPNAYASPTRSLSPQQRTQYATNEPKWYDRILDVVLGEDETSTKNRIALICQSCRLVNGQALPGAKSLEDIGKWRCNACHTMNGVESEEKKIMRQISNAVPESWVSPSNAATAGSRPDDSLLQGNDDAHKTVSEEDEDNDGVEETPPVIVPPARSTRSKARQRTKA